MSYELFFGLPGRRIIRISELHPYYRSETSLPARKASSALPPALRDFLSTVQSRLPQGTKLAFFKTAFTARFDPAQLAVLRASVSGFADAFEILYFDPTGGGWFDAQKPEGQAQAHPSFTSERGIMKYVAAEDSEILFEPQWFVDGRFFVISPRDQQFLQILKRGERHVIEFCAGPGRPIYRSEQQALAPVVELFKGYLAGRDMNTPEYAFKPSTTAHFVDIGLPRRDSWGRWQPEAGASAILR